MSESKDIRHDLMNVVLLGLVFLVTWFGSGLVLTAGRGLDSVSFKERFTLYVILGGVGFGFILLAGFLNFVFKKRFVKTIVHEPEESPIGGIRFFHNGWLLLIGSFLLTLPLFLLSRSNQDVFPGQITVFGNIWADSVLPAVNENLFIFLGLSLALTGAWYLFYKKGHKSWYGVSKFFLIPLLFGFVWLMFHNAVYGSNSVAQISTFFFGFVGFLLTMLTMSFIPFFVLHFLNNFMISLRTYGLMSNDWVVVGVWLFEFVMIFLLLWLLRKKKR